MSSELNKLKHGLDVHAKQAPEARAKMDAMAAAMEAFEFEKNPQTTQGTEEVMRPNEQGGKNRTLPIWRRIMNTIKSNWSYPIVGGAGVAALAVVVMGPNVADLLRQEPVPTLLPVEREAALPAPAADRSEEPANQPGLADEVAELEAAVQPRADRRQFAIVQKKAASQRERINQLAQSGQAKPAYESIARIAPAPQVGDPVIPQYRDSGRDRFTDFETNPVKTVREDPVSTFSVDVDTASYAFMRSSLNSNVLPQRDAVRVEEMINYFDYDYEVPEDRTEPFKANVEIMPTPWNDGTKLMSIGIKGYEIPADQRPQSNLVFLIDTSGSMNAPDKLPLLRNSFQLLLSSLNPDDTVSIVTYAGSAGTVLEPTQAKDKRKILAALERLSAGGSTAGGEGIRQAYALARSAFKEDGINRVILATDGDFNVGITNTQELTGFVERQREEGISLSVLGFGRGNYNDELMQSLAQNGNGNAAYIDTLSEARKVLVEEAGSTLFTIAKDVKLQVEFNPSVVSEYRLIGYETRSLDREDFNNDKVDAGDIGAGHTVTALYEITPAGSSAELIDELRYGETQVETQPSSSDEYGFLKIRYKMPDSDTSTLVTRPLVKADEVSSTSQASDNLRFAASVAAFGQILRGGEHTGSFDHDDVIALSQSAKGADLFGYRAEFINLVRNAKSASALPPQ